MRIKIKFTLLHVNTAAPKLIYVARIWKTDEWPQQSGNLLKRVGLVYLTVIPQ